MPRPLPSRLAVLALALALPMAPGLGACSRGDGGAQQRLLAREERAPAPAAAPVEPAGPGDALGLDASAVAARLGSFDWQATVDWSVVKAGEEAQRVHAVEHHRIRQLASGEFEVRAELDPGLGPGSETGKQVIWAGGLAYARALPAPFRERPTDHGRDARRFRDESFRLGADLAALFGPGLKLEPAGEGRALGRAARRYRVTLAKAEPKLADAPLGLQHDPDTTRRRAFLEGRTPLQAEGELLADAATGAPLELRLAGAFGAKDLPGVRTQVELVARVKSLAPGPVKAPDRALPDERKPAGPSTALEAAGLKRRGEKPGDAEPGDEPE